MVLSVIVRTPLGPFRNCTHPRPSRTALPFWLGLFAGFICVPFWVEHDNKKGADSVCATNPFVQLGCSTPAPLGPRWLAGLVHFPLLLGSVELSLSTNKNYNQSFVEVNPLACSTVNLLPACLKTRSSLTLQPRETLIADLPGFDSEGV